MSNMKTVCCFGAWLCLMWLFLSISPASPAVAQMHHSRGVGEREEDGAYSPRDKNHRIDGSHNTEFDHEAILGSHKAAEEFDNLDPEESKRRLNILLTKMDLNKDDTISRPELKSWILRSFRMLSEEESNDRFEDADENKDGKVTWKEYLADTFGTSSNEIGEEDEKLISSDQVMFDIADVDKDGNLSRKEFIMFSHPEEHPEMHPLIINQTLEEKDTNKDGFIDLQEYIGEKGKSKSKEWLIEENEKFEADYDRNKDGRLDHSEILEWLIPSNDDIADEEVDHLFDECDLNGDDSISFEEAIDNHDVFVGSEATDYGDHLHKLHVFDDEL